ncbi:MAG: non-homologous end-joining DNA ligase [Chloroflexota bacterium]|nr:non-homologous end-joining DNA ligase [Chloroflexota bacterium]
MKLIRPMLATLTSEVPSGAQWTYEEKYDGIRALAYRRKGKVRLWSRNLLDLTAGFPDVAAAIRALPGRDLVLDGELVVFDTKGVSRFQLLQRRGAGGRMEYAVFDLLERDGTPLMKRPLKQRRVHLEGVVGTGRVLRLARRLGKNGKAAYSKAETREWEGIIAKDETSTYQPGLRSRSWLKVKVRKQSEFVIGGFTAPTGSRTHLGALLVGLYDGLALRYAGKVGSGYTRESLAELATLLAPLRTEKLPFADAPELRKMKGATWVKLKLVAQIAFAEWTADGKLRQPVFLGLRRDKSPRECRWDERER